MHFHDKNAGSLLRQDRWPTMRLSVVLPVFALLLGSIIPTRASEELSVDKLSVQMRVHRFVHAMEVGFGSLWTISCGCECGSTLVRIETTNGEAKDFTVHEISSAGGMAIGEDVLWLSDIKRNAIFGIDPKDLSVLRQIPAPMLSIDGTIAAGGGVVWAVTAENLDRTLTRFNGENGQVEATISFPSSISGVVVAYGAVWVSGFSNEIYRVDPKSNTITSTIKLRSTPQDMAAGEGSIWVLIQGDLSIQRIDGGSGELLSTIETGLSPGSASITVGGGYVWVSMPGVPLTKIDPTTNRVLHKFVGGHGIGGYIRYGAGSLWIAGGRISKVQPPN